MLRALQPAAVGRDLAIACAYLVAAFYGEAQSSTGHFATFWPPSGILLAALLLTPVRGHVLTLAAVFAANVAFNSMVGIPITAGVLYSICNLAEGVAGAWLIRRMLGTAPRFDQARQVAIFGVAAIVGCAATALLGAGVAVVWGGGGRYLDHASVWWAADSLGVVSTAPAILAWVARSDLVAPRERPLEWGIFVATLLALVAWVFVLPLGAVRVAPVAVTALPLLTWSVWRLGPRATALAVLVVTGTAIWNANHEIGLFAGMIESPTGVARVQGVLVGLGVTSLLAAASVLDLQRTTAALRASEERLELALGGASDGVWDWNVRTGDTFVSTRMLQLFGYRPGDLPPRIETIDQLVVEEDLQRVRAAMEESIATDDLPYDVTFRVKRADGQVRWLHALGQVHRDEQGHPVRMVGSARDVTEQHDLRKRVHESALRLEESRDDLLVTLNLLQACVVMTDAGGVVTWISQPCLQLGLGEAAPGLTWQEVLPVEPAVRMALEEMSRRPAAMRTRTPSRLLGRGQRRVEIEILDDPRDARRRIFSLHDVSELHDLRDTVTERAHHGRLVGRSVVMQRIYQQVRELSLVDTTVLVTGETGTGKELVARAIHEASARSAKSFVAVNCAAFTESLLTSQLFGHKRGAFTGALEHHRGVFEAADGGTIFLDEIGDMPLGAQALLLRVLQEREVTRVGDERPRRVNVRVLAATNRNLGEEVSRGTFRADLLYRLRVAEIFIAPLRDHREDIPLLAGVFLRESAAACGKPVLNMSPAALQALVQFPWPGNVRELRNSVEAAVIQCRSGTIEATDIPLAMPLRSSLADHDQPPPSGVAPEADPLGSLEAALRRARGNRTIAARDLGISRATLYRRLAELRGRRDR